MKQNRDQSRAARGLKISQFGLAAGLITRLMLLASLSFVVKLTALLFTVFKQEISGRDLVHIFWVPTAGSRSPSATSSSRS